MDYTDSQGTYCIDGSVLELDCGYMTEYICQNSSNCMLQVGAFYDMQTVLQ